MNKVILVGRLAQEPKLAMTRSGAENCVFTVAVDKRTGTDGERRADFIRCVAWSGTAKFVSSYLKKGERIALSGSIHTYSYDDESGNRRYVTEVLAENVEFAQSRSEARPEEGGKSEDFYEGDLPF